jgi:hypothetical protein
MVRARPSSVREITLGTTPLTWPRHPDETYPRSFDEREVPGHPATVQAPNEF